MKIFKTLFLFLVSTQLWALTAPLQVSPRMPSEAWVKFTCFGIVTPRYTNPTIEKTIMTAHLKVNAGLPFPRFDDLRDANSEFIKNITKTCTERRWSKAVLDNFSGVWLDWGTDWGYTRYEIGEEFVYNVNQCRAVGKPCDTPAQCCGRSQFLATCNVAARTCESTAIDHQSGGAANPL